MMFENSHRKRQASNFGLYFTYICDLHLNCFGRKTGSWESEGEGRVEETIHGMDEKECYRIIFIHCVDFFAHFHNCKKKENGSSLFSTKAENEIMECQIF